MIIREIYDIALIEATMKKPYIWPYIHDDLCNIDDFYPAQPISGIIDYLGVFIKEEYCGFFMLVRENFATYEIHTILEKNCRGEMAIKAANLVIEWIFNNTQCIRLVTKIPESNACAEKLASACGMTIYGINPDSFSINGAIQTMKLYGISKLGELCQQQQ